MKGRNKLNLYLPIFIVTIFSIIFLVERIYTNNKDSAQSNNVETDKGSLELISNEKWKEYYNTEYTFEEKSLIIYEGRSEYSKTIKNNVKFVLNSISVKTYTKDIKELKKDDSLDKYDTIIICVQDLSILPYSSNKLMKFVSKGGGILFANESLLNEALPEYSELLGIQEVKEPEFVGSIIFDDNYLVNSSGEIFSESVIDYDIRNYVLSDEANIHVSSNDENNIPIIWDINHGKGFVSVSNSSLMTSKNGRGLIVSAYSTLHEAYAYPVINSAIYFIDDFPSPIPAGYDSKIYEEYSCSIKDFYTNIWWPLIHKLANEKGVKFTAYLIDNYEDNVEGPFEEQSFREDFQYYVNALLADGGEMGIHGYNHQPLVLGDYDYNDPEITYKSWPNASLALASIKKVLRYTEDLAGGSMVSSYVPPSNMLSEEMYLKMQEEVPEVKIYSAIYVGDEAGFEQEFNVLENGTINLPRLYSGMELPSISEYMMLNELSYHYIVSHFIHPDDILDEERRSEEGFEFMSQKYAELMDYVNSLGLRNTTASEAGAALQRYQITNVNQTYSENKLTLEISGIHDEVYYFLKTNGKEIKGVSGCEIREVAENYYLLTINQNLVEIEMEQL